MPGTLLSRWRGGRYRVACLQLRSLPETAQPTLQSAQPACNVVEGT